MRYRPPAGIALGSDLYSAQFTEAGPTSGPAFETSIDLLYNQILAKARAHLKVCIRSPVRESGTQQLSR